MYVIGCDHGGYDLKQILIENLKLLEVDYTDIGCYSTASVDYPDIAKSLAESVASGEFERGILVCGTGIGMSIAANKVPGIRATLCADTYSARMSREHNNSNILVLGGRVVGPATAIEILETWMKTPFSGGRHAVRVDKISDIEKQFITEE